MLKSLRATPVYRCIMYAEAASRPGCIALIRHPSPFLEEDKRGWKLIIKSQLAPTIQMHLAASENKLPLRQSCRYNEPMTRHSSQPRQPVVAYACMLGEVIQKVHFCHLAPFRPARQNRNATMDLLADRSSKEHPSVSHHGRQCSHAPGRGFRSIYCCSHRLLHEHI